MPDPRALAVAAVRLVVRGRWASLAALLGLVASVWAVAVARGPDPPFDNGLEVWFLEDDPALVKLREFHATFGNDEAVVVVWRDEAPVWTPRRLQLLADASRRLAAVRHVEAVTSLATVLHTGVERDDRGREEVVIDRLYATPVDEAVAARAAARARGAPLLFDALVSKDERATLLSVQPARDADMDRVRPALLREVRAALEESFRAAGEAGARWAWGGTGVLNEALNEASQRDSALFTGLNLLVIVVCLGAALRRASAVLLAVASVAAASALLVGTYLALGYALNMVTLVLPSLVLVIGLTDSVYFIHAWLQEGPGLQAGGLSRPDAIARVVGRAALPGLFNSVTSAAGFLSFVGAHMAVLRQFGAFAGLGIALAYLSSVVVCAVGFDLLDVTPRSKTGAPPLDGALRRLARFVARRRRAVLAASAALALLGLAGVTRLRFDSDPMRYFFPDHPLRQDDAWIREAYGPYLPLELVVDGGRPDAVKEPALLRALDGIGRHAVESEEAVGGATSVADVVRHLHRVLADEEGLPATLEAVEQELLLGYDPDRRDDPRKLVDWPPRGDGGWRQARLTLRCTNLGLRGGRDLVERIEADAKGRLPPGARLEPAGYGPLYARLVDYLVLGQLWSIGSTFLVIALLLLAVFRSLRLALLSLPANLLPVLLVLGFMGWAGIHLDIATVLIAAIALGVAVDDTIHFLFRYRELALELGDEALAVEETLRTSGAAIATSSLVIALGFGVVGLASLRSVALFGQLTALTMVAALVAELLVTPAVLLTFPPRPRTPATP